MVRYFFEYHAREQPSVYDNNCVSQIKARKRKKSLTPWRWTGGSSVGRRVPNKDHRALSEEKKEVDFDKLIILGKRLTFIALQISVMLTPEASKSLPREMAKVREMLW
jgi:hypothetical protein